MARSHVWSVFGDEDDGEPPLINVYVVDINYEAFASPNFDANDYANAILAGEPFPPSASLTSGTLPSGSKISKAPSLLSNLSDPSKGDISVAISKLTLGLDDVSKQIKAVVSNYLSS